MSRKNPWKETSYGTKGGEGPNTGKKAVTFTCAHPLRDQPSKNKRVFSSNAREWSNPIALWYRCGKGEWHLNTVVDGDNMADWAGTNYTHLPAKLA